MGLQRVCMGRRGPYTRCRTPVGQMFNIFGEGSLRGKYKLQKGEKLLQLKGGLKDLPL